ncbi:MAG: outer membrane beta-barrel family protein [Croceivirga sp.]
MCCFNSCHISNSKKLKVYGSTFLFILFAVLGINAQESISISGTVVDQQNQPIEVGDVVFLQANSKELVRYAPLSKGAFSIGEIKTGSYILEISALGYATFREAIVLDAKSIIAITLQEAATELEEVDLVGAKNPIEYKDGNVKVDVQNPYFSSIPDLVDLMSRLPRVQMSSDRESISILGKGAPLLYLGNQRISMDEFRGLPIDGIASIELINNPSAKSEAEGRAVVLVRLKKNINLGFQGSLQETASQKRNFNNYLGLNSSFATKNWTIRGNLGYNQLLQWESNSFLFEIPQREVLVDYSVLIPRNVRTQLNPTFGVYHQWNESDYISLNASARLQTNNAPFFTDTFIVDRNDETFIRTETENDNAKNYYGAAFNFNKKLTDSWNLFAGLQYSGFQQTLGTEINNSENGAEFLLDQTRNQEYDINSLAFRLDIENILTENLKWQWGTNISLANAEAFTAIQNIQQSTINEIDFDYQEDLYAIYSSFSGKLTKNIDFEFGARLEHNEVNSGAMNDEIPVISRKNTSLFPKASVSLDLDSTRTLSLNYARNINRPDFSRASSIAVFINPFLEGTGNVNLRPTFTDELSVNVQKGNASFYATVYQSSNPTNFTISYDEVMDTGVLSLVNVEKEIGFYTGVTVPYTKGKWTSNNTVTLYYTQIQDSSATLGKTSPVLYAYTNHQFKIAKDTTLAFGAYALSKRQEGIFQRNGVLALEASISKTIFKNLDCTLRFNDITRGTNFEESYAINGVIADGIYFSDLREVALSLKYLFGTREKAKFKNRDVDSNLNRIN